MAWNHAEVKGLFSDITRYLSETLKEESLSANAENERATLVRRVTILFPDDSLLPGISRPYLDMNGRSQSEVIDDEYITQDSLSLDKSKKEETVCYEDFCENSMSNTKDIPQETNEEFLLFYDNLNIAELHSLATKFGPLLRKERFIFMDQYRRCWAGLIGHLLLVYSGERDTKPSFNIDLHGYEARPAPNYIQRDLKRRDMCFEIVCPGKKTFHFIARTSKDMYQWISSICQLSGRDAKSNLQEEKPSTSVYVSKSSRKLPSLPSNESVDTTYDDIHTFQQYNEEIYQYISDIYHGPMRESVSHLDIMRGQPNVPKHSDDELSEIDSVYDDIGAISNDTLSSDVLGPQYSQDFNNIDQEHSRETQEINSSFPPTVINGKQQADINYDDIGIKENSINILQEDSLKENINSSRIHQIIKKMEANFVVRKKDSIGIIPKKSLTSQTTIGSKEELYELIERPNV